MAGQGASRAAAKDRGQARRLGSDHRARLGPGCQGLLCGPQPRHPGGESDPAGWSTRPSDGRCMSWPPTAGKQPMSRRARAVVPSATRPQASEALDRRRPRHACSGRHGDGRSAAAAPRQGGEAMSVRTASDLWHVSSPEQSDPRKPPHNKSSRATSGGWVVAGTVNTRRLARRCRVDLFPSGRRGADALALSNRDGRPAWTPVRTARRSPSPNRSDGATAPTAKRERPCQQRGSRRVPLRRGHRTRRPVGAHAWRAGG